MYSSASLSTHYLLFFKVTFIISPLEQFTVANLIMFEVFSINFLANNLDVYIIFYLLLLFFNTLIALKSLNYFGNLFSLVFATFYKFFQIMVSNNFSISNIFVSWFFSLALFLTLSNSFGILPFSFTITTHLFVSISISFFFFFWINLIFFLRFFIEWGIIFLPAGAPVMILPLIVPIELLSYFSRVLSLAIRLFANMMSGHTLLVILGGFMFSLFSLNLVYLIPIILIHLIILMEVGVAFLQVYVFIVLTGLYLQDVVTDSSH